MERDSRYTFLNSLVEIFEVEQLVEMHDKLLQKRGIDRELEKVIEELSELIQAIVILLDSPTEKHIEDAIHETSDVCNVLLKLPKIIELLYIQNGINKDLDLKFYSGISSKLFLSKQKINMEVL